MLGNDVLTKEFFDLFWFEIIHFYLSEEDSWQKKIAIKIEEIDWYWSWTHFENVTKKE